MANTGYKAWRTLEEYDLDTGVATGKTKPNVETDANYVAPVYDINSCPLPPPPTGWRTIEPYCEQDNGQNTGYTVYATLEQYNLNTEEATGVTKPNVDTDPDYMAPTYTPGTCPLPDTQPPVLTDPVTWSSGNYHIMAFWRFTDNVQVTSQAFYYREFGSTGPFIHRPLTATDTGQYVPNLKPGTTYEFYITACDAMGNCEDTPVVKAKTKVILYEVTLSRSYKQSSPCVGSNGIYYIDTEIFNYATKIYTTSEGSSANMAPPGYYSNGAYWRYWTGSGFTTDSGTCGGFVITR